ncbi:MAG: TolC family protein, partial [Rhodothermales bacterium]
GVLPNPELSGSMEVPIDDTTGAITGLSLGLSFDLMDLITRPAERAAAKADLNQVSMDLAWEEWQVAQAARQQVFDAVFLERQAELADAQEKALKENLRVLTDARKRRLVTETERSAAESAYWQARTERLDLSTQLDTTRLGLLRMLGFPPEAALQIDPHDVPYAGFPDEIDAAGGAMPVPTTVDTTIARLPAVPPADSLLDQLEQRRIDLVALRYGYESQDAALRASILRQFPSISIGLTGGQATDRVKTIGPTVAIRLPFLNHNQGEIAVARATREQLRQEYVARLFETRSLVRTLISRLTGLRSQLHNAEMSALSQRRLVAAYGVALDAGNADVLTYYSARKDLIDAEIAVVQFRQALASVTLALDTATGGLLTTI